MKKILIAFMVASSLIALAPGAQAEIAVSVSYGNRGHSNRNIGHHDRYEHRHHRSNVFFYTPYDDRYYYHRYVFPRPMYQATVIRTYDVRPTKDILENREKIGIADIIVLSRAGVSDDAIIDKIARTGTTFNLSVEEVEAMRKEGVSVRVINFMLNTSKK